MDAISRAIESAKAGFQNMMPILLDEPLKNYTSFKIGGPVRAMFFPKDLVSFTGLCKLLYEYEITPLILGCGTNLLAGDGTHDIVVVKSTGSKNIVQSGETEILAEAGAMMSKLAVFASRLGLSGLEFAHGIPGTAGGAVVMNAGAYGGEMKDIVYSTTAYNAKTGDYECSAGEHEFAYRHSRFLNTDDIVLSTKIRLKKGDKECIKKQMDELSARRHQSQPLDMPSAGSTFKRPLSGYAAALIEEAGLKGYTIGGAQVSEKHAGFIVNRSDATFEDVMSLIEHVQVTVQMRFGIELEPEVKIIM